MIKEKNAKIISNNPRRPVFKSIDLLNAKHQVTMQKEIEKQSVVHIAILREMLSITSHRVRKPIATCLGLIQLLDPNYKTNICKEDLEAIFESLKPSILELDNYVKELTLYMTKAELKEKNRLQFLINQNATK